MHISTSKLTIIGPDNSFSPGWQQAIICPKTGISLIRPLGINISEIWIETNQIIQENAFEVVISEIASMSCRLKRVKLIDAYPYHPIQDKLSHHVIASMDWHSRNLITWNGGQFGYQSMCPNIVCYKLIWIQQSTGDTRVRWNINSIYFTSQTSHCGCNVLPVLLHTDTYQLRSNFVTSFMPPEIAMDLIWSEAKQACYVPICDRADLWSCVDMWPKTCQFVTDCVRADPW